MIKFLKENIIFITSSILLLGLFMSAPLLKKIPSSDQQTSANQTSFSNTPNTIGSQIASNVVFPSINTKTVTKKVSNPTLPTSLTRVNTNTRQRFHDDEDVGD